MRRLLALSRWSHRWAGLLFALYLVWMGGTGVLLNHPALLAGLDVPGVLVPPVYRIEAWERSALIDLVTDPEDSRVLYGGGRLGLFRSLDGGHSFYPWNPGLPERLWPRKTSDLHLVAERGHAALFAATRGGLHVSSPLGTAFRPVDGPAGRSAVIALVETEEELLAFTDSTLFAAPLGARAWHFEERPLRRATPAEGVVAVFGFLHLHDGSAWGLPGRLLFDALGLLLVFLSVSALFVWYLPRRRRVRGALRLRRRGLPPRAGVLRTLLRWHVDLGVWAALLLALVSLTGAFLRPPMIVALDEREIPRVLYPAPFDGTVFAGTIQSATYDRLGSRLLVQSAEGVFATDPAARAPLEPVEIAAPIFGMGAPVFEREEDGSLLVGSFYGLFRQHPDGRIEDVLLREEIDAVPRGRPGRHMVTGLLRFPSGESFVATHEDGLVPLPGTHRPAPSMPALDRDARGMPLWNWLFELHNGRIFRDLVGDLYVLIVPVGGFGLFLLTLSGILDWWWAKRRKAAREIPRRV